MRSTGGAVQQSDAQRGMRVFVAFARVRLAKVCVNVRMPNAGVIMFVGVDAMTQQGANAQRAAGDQYQADEALRSAGKPLGGGGALQEPDKQADQHNAAGVAQAPVEAQSPGGVLFAVCGEGRQRGQVIRSTDHVGESRHKTDE